MVSEGGQLSFYQKGPETGNLYGCKVRYGCRQKARIFFLFGNFSMQKLPGCGASGCKAGTKPLEQKCPHEARAQFALLQTIRETSPILIPSRINVSSVYPDMKMTFISGCRASAWSASSSDAADAYRVLLLAEIRRFRGQEIEIAPRRAFAIFDGPARAIRAACAIRDSARNLGLLPALGIHTGECEMSAGQVQGTTVEVTR
jgi:hypothetical protein